MAVLDNFGVTILTLDPLSADRRKTSTDLRWAEVEEYNPPGSDTETSSPSTCRRYIGVSPLQNSETTDRTSTEFAIDYKVRCGFVFPDQHDTGAEVIVFRTYLDGEKIGGASVNRDRWERSGTYRQRKQGRRYRVENEHRWIRQRWTFDPGLHGTIKIEVWRERTRIPVAQGWGFIDLTGDEDLVVGQRDLLTMAHEPNAKRPRVKSTVKVDLLPLATFEFEYRSSNTLRLLGVAEIEVDEKIDTGVQSCNSQHVSNRTVVEDDNNLWRTITGTSSSGDTFDTSIDISSDGLGSYVNDRRLSCSDTSSIQAPISYPTIYTDAIGRNLLTGWSPTEQKPSCFDPLTLPTQGAGYDNAVPVLEQDWWIECNAPLKAEETQRHGNNELIDLTMLD